MLFNNPEFPTSWEREIKRRCPQCGVETSGGRPCGYHKAHERHERRKAARQSLSKTSQMMTITAETTATTTPTMVFTIAHSADG